MNKFGNLELERKPKRQKNPILEKEKVNEALLKQKERKNVKLYDDAFNQLAAYASMKRLTRDDAIIELIGIAKEHMSAQEQSVFEFVLQQSTEK